MGGLRCAIIGAGALGNEVARILGLIGTAEVLVVDPDTVEASNLPRSFFFNCGDTIGRNKAEAVSFMAKGFFPDSHWIALNSEVADVGFQSLATCHILFSCVDSELARLEVAYISRKLQIPMVDGGLGVRNHSRGRVTYFAGARGSGCFGCLLRSRRRQELLGMWMATLRPCSGREDDTAFSSTPTMAGIVGCLQADMGLRSLFELQNGIGTTSRSYEIQIHPIVRMEELAVRMSLQCPFHEDDTILCALPCKDAVFQDLLDSVGADTIVLDWPICTRARCLNCQKEWPPMLRLGALRRKGNCPGCGSRSILELETVRNIGCGSPWLKQRPSALNMPEHHLYSVRKPA